MDHTLLKALAALAPTSVLLIAALILFNRNRTWTSLLQVVGAAGLVIAVLTHVAEALHWFPWMNWGLENSPGHYLDLAGAGAGITLFPAGYLLEVLRRRRIESSKDE